MDDDTLCRIRTAINAEIAELRENSDKHSHEVQTNAIMIVEGLRRALRITEEIFLKPSAQPELSPCDVCRYYPPSSMDGKPCTICPAERKNDERFNQQTGGVGHLR